MQSARVLVVDANDRDSALMLGMLRNWHMRPTWADTTDGAVRALQQAAADNDPFHAILLDTLTVRPGSADEQAFDTALPELPPVIRLAAVGAQPASDGASTFHGILNKPLMQSELLDALMVKLGAGSVSAQTVPGIVALAPGHGLQILLAEDNPVNQMLALRLLERIGHHTTLVDNGRDAVEAVASGSFDAILMDLQMPEMSGFEATQRIREREAQRQRYTPIVAMTAHAMQGDRERCLAAGMDGYVSKPTAAGTCRGVDPGHRHGHRAVDGVRERSPSRNGAAAARVRPPIGAIQSGERRGAVASDRRDHAELVSRTDRGHAPGAGRRRSRPAVRHCAQLEGIGREFRSGTHYAGGQSP